MEQQSLLSDMEFNPVFASTGKRFLNYLIDGIIFYIIAVILLVAVFYTEDIADSASNNLMLRLVAMLMFAVFYFLSELIFKGRSIGKFITGTKAVNADGSDMRVETILLRSLSRVVPFEPFSAFGGHPWHDKWTRTHVIDVRKTEQNNLGLQQL